MILHRGVGFAECLIAQSSGGWLYGETIEGRQRRSGVALGCTMRSQEEIFTAIRTRFAGVDRYDLTNLLIIESKSFLWGSMNRVKIKRKDGSDKTVYVWEPESDKKTGKPTGNYEFFEDIDDLIPFVSFSQPAIADRAAKIAEGRFLSKVSPVDIISGAIAILMTFTMIFIIIHQAISNTPLDVPVVLSGAITTILGFYFGRATTPANSSPPPP